MGAGSRLVDVRRRPRARRAGRRLPRLRPRRAARADGAPAGRGARASRRAGFVVGETLVRFDHGAGVAEVLAGDPDEIAGRLETRASRGIARTAAPPGPIARFPDRERYEAMVREVQGAHRRGRRLPVRPLAAGGAPDLGDAARLYRALRRVNPSPYLFLLELDGISLVGSSPERLVACEDGKASLCPIAGTTEPTEGDVERLLSSEKDRAEHVMLVDLGRNDLSRVCRAGTRARRARHGGRALLACLAPRLRGRRASCATASRRSTCCARASPPER